MPLQKCNCSSRGKSIQSQGWGALSGKWGTSIIPIMSSCLGRWLNPEWRDQDTCLHISWSPPLTACHFYFLPRCKKFVVLLSQGWNIDFRSYQHLIFASKRLLTAHSNSTKVANHNRHWLSRAEVKEMLGEGVQMLEWILSDSARRSASASGVSEWVCIAPVPWMGGGAAAALKPDSPEGWGCTPRLFPALKRSEERGRRRGEIFRGDVCLTVNL